MTSNEQPVQMPTGVLTNATIKKQSTPKQERERRAMPTVRIALAKQVCNKKTIDDWAGEACSHSDEKTGKKSESKVKSVLF